MKQYYFIITTLLFFGSANSQIIDIPDPVLKAKLVAYGATFNPHNGMGFCGDTGGMSSRIDMNGNGEIERFEAYRVCELYLNDCGISSLEGLQYFPRLERLYFNNNNLTSLDVSNYPSLIHLECNNNQLTSLNIGSKQLYTLRCENNLLTTLDITSMPDYYYGGLYCKNNLLTNLNASESNVSRIDCQNNLLTTLNLNNRHLRNLNCANNQLTRIDLEQSAIYTIDCSNNLITTLNIKNSPSLSKIICQDNLLTTLDVRGLGALMQLYYANNVIETLLTDNLPNLQYIDCSNNALTTIPMGATTRISGLNCSNNQLTTLDLNNHTNLVALDCRNNPLTSLYIKNGSIEFPNSMFLSGNPNLQHVCVDEAQISSIANVVNNAGLNAVVDSNCVVLSLPEQELSNHSITIFPNPVQEYLNFKPNQDLDILSISIYNNLGQLVRTNQLTANTFNIEVSELKTGIYFIQIKTNVGSIVSKFLKT